MSYIKNLIVALSIIFCLILFILGIYDRIVIQSSLPRINTILTQAQRGDRESPELARRLAVVASGGWVQVKSYVVLSLRSEFGMAQGYSMLNWHINNALWVLLLPLHYNEQQIFGLWCSLVPNGHGCGLNEVAVIRYGKNLDALDLEQLATLIVLARSPVHFANRPDLLNEDAQRLIHKYEKIYDRRSATKDSQVTSLNMDSSPTIQLRASSLLSGGFRLWAAPAEREVVSLGTSDNAG